MKFIATFFFITGCLIAMAQQGVQPLELIRSKGDIPAVFLKNKEPKAPKTVTDKTIELNNSLILRELFLGGRVSYGDEITLYLQQTASRLLKNDPELLGRLSFFTYKSSEVKSFSTSGGLIFISTGLIAQLSDENQLAFAIAHEIGHVVNKHKNYPYIFYEDRYAKATGTFEQRKHFNTFFIRTVEENMLADAYATDLLSKSGVDVKRAASYFDILLYAYLPFDEVEVDKSFLNLDSTFVIPDSYFQAVSVEINPEENGDSNRGLSLDALKQRKAAVDEKVTASRNTTTENKSDQFSWIQTRSRCEVIRMNLVDRDYVAAVYHTYVLSQNYPEDDFLERSLAKALYALAVYKINKQEENLDLEKYQGSISAVGNLFKKLTDQQAGILAMIHLKKYLNKKPEDAYMVSLLRSLIRNLKEVSGFNYSSFRSASDLDIGLSKMEDSTALSKYDKIKISKREFAVKNYETEFHLFVLDFVKDDPVIRSQFNTERSAVPEGKPTGIKHVLMTDPIFRSPHLQFGLDLLQAEFRIGEIYAALAKTRPVEGISVQPLKSGELTSGSETELKAISAIRLWLSECTQHLDFGDFISMESDELQTALPKTEANYLLYSFADSKSKHTAFSVSRLGLIRFSSGKIEYAVDYYTDKKYNTLLFLTAFKRILTDIK